MDRTRPVTQVDVEQRIAELTDRLEAQTEDFAEAAESDARAEARWKRLLHTALLSVDGSSNRPKDAESRKAKAHALCRDPEWVARALDCAVSDLPDADQLDPYAVHLIAAARREHAREAVRSTGNMLSAQQTLLRSISALT